ncbi:hypothetical protein SAURM35S_08636 [Streptomyces aurantiogriseus]
MTEQSAAHDAAVTDRGRLAGSAYSSDRDLAARQSLYQWQTPRYDLPGIEDQSWIHARGRTPADLETIRAELPGPWVC